MNLLIWYALQSTFDFKPSQQIEEDNPKKTSSGSCPLPPRSIDAFTIFVQSIASLPFQTLFLDIFSQRCDCAISRAVETYFKVSICCIHRAMHCVCPNSWLLLFNAFSYVVVIRQSSFPNRQNEIVDPVRTLPRLLF